MAAIFPRGRWVAISGLKPVYSWAMEWYVPAIMLSKMCTLNMWKHYSDVIMGTVASQITSPAIVYSSVCSGADQRKHQSSASLAFVRRIHRWPVNFPHKWPVTRKMFPYDDVIMSTLNINKCTSNKLLDGVSARFTLLHNSWALDVKEWPRYITEVQTWSSQCFNKV